MIKTITTLLVLFYASINFMQRHIEYQSFDSLLTLNVGNQKVYAVFYGERHTRDNVIGYFPGDSVVFGGCLIKEIGATKGNLEDANVVAWPKTVEKLKQKYKYAKNVIPGHGQPGGTELFDYTIHLLKKEVSNKYP